MSWTYEGKNTNRELIEKTKRKERQAFEFEKWNYRHKEKEKGKKTNLSQTDEG